MRWARRTPSNMAREYFVTTLIVPAVAGIVKEVEIEAKFSVEAGAVQRLGPEDTREILDQVRAAIVAIRQAGSPTHSLPREQP